MRALFVLAALVIAIAPARADDVFRAYRGQIVISPDAPPTSSPELVKHLEANATKDHRYELIKGPPWDVNLVGVLAKDPGSVTLSLVFVDASADKSAAPLHAIEVTAHHGIVIAHTSATTAAGFETSKTYLVRLIAGKAVLASAELTLRP